jgi:hypothetical protein
MYINQTRYTLLSPITRDVGQIFEFATIDENVSDFVGGRVENRLLAGLGTHVYQWFDPQAPEIPDQIPIADGEQVTYRDILEAFVFADGRTLATDQVNAIIDGLDARIQLLQGPPGTGKTMTTAIAVLLRVLVRQTVGSIVLVAANTHTALDNLLERIDQVLDTFQQISTDRGLLLPNLMLTKVHSSRDAVAESPSRGRIVDFPAEPSRQFIHTNLRDNVLIVGGTTSALLKLTDQISGGRDFRDGFYTPMLIVDEASMIVFPHFLALATIVQPNGEIMLAGDHRQLAPIIAHDWEREDRPPVVLYQPFVSAYQAIENLAHNNPNISENAILRSALSFTFRLPPAIRELIARLYRLDNIELEGLAREEIINQDNVGEGSWEQIWRGDTGLYLVLHSERGSRNINEIEVQIIEQILNADEGIPNGSVAIVTPYRAQRSLLQTRLNVGQGPVDIVDTVERLQGGERPIVIVSAVASDPSAISANTEFILNLNRSNVAFSRSQNRLIVVCSESLINHIPVELDQYDSTMLWKALRNICSRVIATINLDGTTVNILTLPLAIENNPIQ